MRIDVSKEQLSKIIAIRFKYKELDLFFIENIRKHGRMINISMVSDECIKDIENIFNIKIK